MQNFTYHNPTKVINGKNTQKEIGNILANDDIKSVLLVYGMNSIKKSGLYDEIISILKEKNIRVVEHAGVKSNPVLTHATKGADLAKSHKVDAVLSVGGGSVLDECKAIAAGAKVDFGIWDFYTAKAVAKEALPIYAILTISATGSEMNSGSVLTNEATSEKFAFGSLVTFPKVSIINPEFTYSLPTEYLIYSAVDIIAHTIEIYFTATTLPLIQKRFMENILKTVVETTEKALKDPKDYDARAEFSLAATWALNGLTKPGTGGSTFPNHMIEHSLSAIYDVAHGAGLAVVILAWMKYFKEERREIFTRFAKEIFQVETAEDGIKAFEAWLKKIGSPTTLEDLKIEKSDTLDIAKNAFISSTNWGMGKKYTTEVIKDILDLA